METIMDTRLRQLERAASLGDEQAQLLLKHAQCRSFGHDWLMKSEKISTYPVRYQSYRVSCKRCGREGDDAPPRRPDKPSEATVEAIHRLLNRFSYGNVDEFYRELDDIENGR
jgi:hypothetical protein